MKTQNTYWMIISLALTTTIAVLASVTMFFWHRISSDDQIYLGEMVINHFGYFFTAGFVLILAFGFAADWIFRAYVKPINRMAEEIDLINRVNPNLRVSIRGSSDVRGLGHIINQSAERLAELTQKRNVNQDIAKSESENEKAILATFLSYLPQAIVVCNLDGQIVFYNRKAKAFLLPAKQQGHDARENYPKWIGIGRSIYHFIDQDLIQEALERMVRLLAGDQNTVSERFLLAIDQREVLPAEILPVLDSQHHATGYIIYVEDLEAKMKQDKEDAKHLQLWQHQLTQSISIIKTATELLKDELSESKPDQLQIVQILVEQSSLAARLWTKKEIAEKWSDSSFWPLTPIDVQSWSMHLCKKITQNLNLEIKIEPVSLNTMIRMDIHHLTLCVVSMLELVHLQFNVDAAHAEFYEKESWLYVDVLWKGRGLEDDAIKKWKDLPERTIDNRPVMTPNSILAYHGAKLWPHRKPEQPESSGLRLLIPTMQDSTPMNTNGQIAILPESRPEYYDFNLFQQVGPSAELEQQRLLDLTYTVFDTETTGLDAGGDDEIISIGAMRIVNARLLQEDQFNQLIDPRRHLPWASIKYHGIRPEMLIDQPPIEKVLPKFRRFVQGTVLVGHNVAFDMRMLQVKEALTGVKFTNPVLDTMLLSSIVHPAHENHNLSGVAERMGINIKGRHTAIGDAAATGEIFLKLIPLLSQKGIHTIGEAIEASKTSYYARLKY